MARQRDPGHGGAGQFGTAVEYNELFQIGLNGSGFAAIYSCCGPVDAAGMVTRFNFVHPSPDVNAIGWDNQLSGQVGYGNVFYYTQNGYGLNHGPSNSMQNNLIVHNSPRPGATSFQASAGISIACNGLGDVYNCSLKAFAPWLKELQYVDINSTSNLWGQRFKWYLGGICGAIASTDGKNQRVTGSYADSNAMVSQHMVLVHTPAAHDSSSTHLPTHPHLHLSRRSISIPPSATAGVASAPTENMPP
jgi:hypothetical protein